jgi:hypothetical protein
MMGPITEEETMKRIAAMALAAAVMSPAVQAAEVGVTIEIAQPGVYGRIDIGRFPQPAVIVAQPVIIAPPPVVPPPVYVWVPREHRKHWSKHCHKYNACGVPVYFVRHDWYNDNVRYRKSHPPGKGPAPGKGPPKK